MFQHRVAHTDSYTASERACGHPVFQHRVAHTDSSPLTLRGLTEPTYVRNPMLKHRVSSAGEAPR